MNRRSAIKRTAMVMGIAVSESAVSALLSGCQADTSAEGWQPTFMNATQLKTAREAAERILPATDTPGAKDVFAERLMDEMLQVYKKEKSARFLRGLDQLEADAKVKYNNSFANLNPEEMDALITDLMNDAKDIKDDERPFFFDLKEMTFLGYFLSEKVGEEVLVYDPIPGTYDGCIPYDGQRIFSP